MYLRAGVDVCSVFDQILLFRLRRLYVMTSRGESHACIAFDRAPSDADYEAVRCRTPLSISCAMFIHLGGTHARVVTFCTHSDGVVFWDLTADFCIGGRISGFPCVPERDRTCDDPST